MASPLSDPVALAADLRDRLERGRVRHVIAGTGHTPKFAELEGDYTRICVGPAQSGWLPVRRVGP